MKILCEKNCDNPLKIAETQFQNAKTGFQKLKLVSKKQKLPSPAFPLQVLGWKSHKKICLRYFPPPWLRVH